MNEIWKDIKGYENIYQISNFGRVKSLLFNKEKILKPCINTWGYHQVQLFKNKKSKAYRIHRLVAEAFLDNPDNLPEVNHKDENKLNNHVDNLEYCSSQYNLTYGTGIERRTKSKSKKVYQFTKDGKLVKEWDSAMECGRNGFVQSSVVACCNGRLKSHKGYIFTRNIKIF